MQLSYRVVLAVAAARLGLLRRARSKVLAYKKVVKLLYDYQRVYQLCSLPPPYAA